MQEQRLPRCSSPVSSQGPAGYLHSASCSAPAHAPAFSVPPGGAYPYRKHLPAPMCKCLRQESLSSRLPVRAFLQHVLRIPQGIFEPWQHAGICLCMVYYELRTGPCGSIGTPPGFLRICGLAGQAGSCSHWPPPLEQLLLCQVGKQQPWPLVLALRAPQSLM